MVRIIVRHPVASVEEFIAGYRSDDMKAVRDGGGVRWEAVYEVADAAGDLVIMHDFDTVEAAQAFLGAPELGAAMQSLGVTGAPEITIVNVVE